LPFLFIYLSYLFIFFIYFIYSSPTGRRGASHTDSCTLPGDPQTQVAEAKYLVYNIPVEYRITPFPRGSDPERNDRFTEAHTFLRSYDLAPRPPPSLHSPISKLSASSPTCVSPGEKGRGRAKEPNHTPHESLVIYNHGGWRGAKSYAHEKAWSSINHSILSEKTTPHWQAELEFLKNLWGLGTE
jgi:hypothetical protein